MLRSWVGCIDKIFYLWWDGCWRKKSAWGKKGGKDNKEIIAKKTGETY